MASRQEHPLKVPGSSPGLASILLIAMLVLAGCTTVRVRTQPVPLPLPPRPTLQPVPASSVACLSNDAYTRLVNRERALRAWGLQLEAVIQTNNHHANHH